MARDFAASFYKSGAWRRTQRAYMESRHGICERCGGPARIVHHRIHLTPANIHDPDTTLAWENLEALCQECHNREHLGSGATAPGLAFDEEGNMAARRP